MIDQLNREVHVDYSLDLRIVSLVPSQTELLYDLGLEDEVVGITKFCIYPKQWFRSKVRVGGTKNLNLDLIRSLNPTLIIANKEENTKEQIDELAREYPVWISDISMLEEALSMILHVGKLVRKEKQAAQLVQAIRFKQERLGLVRSSKKVLYLIWQNPFMVAGENTFIHDMLGQAGFMNAVNEARYPTFTKEQIVSLEPDFVFLSSEPFPFKEKHVEELQCTLPHAKVKLVDGELFSWYGSRMLHSFDYFRVLNEELAS